MLSGGSNGIVYCWRKGVCVSSGNVIKGGVLCLVVHGDKAVCGGQRGVIKVRSFGQTNSRILRHQFLVYCVADCRRSYHLHCPVHDCERSRSSSHAQTSQWKCRRGGQPRGWWCPTKTQQGSSRGTERLAGWRIRALCCHHHNLSRGWFEQTRFCRPIKTGKWWKASQQ
jgi:hypothetical protein